MYGSTNMSELIDRGIDLITAFNNLSINKKRAILDTASINLVSVVCEVCLNLRRNNIVLTSPIKRKLERFRENIDFYASEQWSIPYKQQIFNSTDNTSFISTLFEHLKPLLIVL